MSKSDEEIRKDISKIDKKIADAVECLRNYDMDVFEYIADVVASVCNVDVCKMLSNDRSAQNVQARWLYWYTYRYLTGFTYERISEETSNSITKQYTYAGIGIGINKMSVMIAEDPLWKRRWGVVKRVANLINEEEEKTFNHVLTIQIPKELKDKITIKIQEV